MSEDKRCRSCGEVKPLDQFYRQRDKADGRSVSCKPCKDAQVLRWKTARSSSAHAYHRQQNRRRKYGVSAADFERLSAEQGGACAICRDPTELVVDHCHATGRFRGLLCNSCNLMLGRSRDRADVLRAAADYLDARGATD